MTKEQAIKDLKYQEKMRAKDIDYRVNNLVIATAIEALEKQIPKKLHIYANGTEHCPNCDANLTGIGFKFCVECGQALD